MPIVSKIFPDARKIPQVDELVLLESHTIDAVGRPYAMSIHGYPDAYLRIVYRFERFALFHRDTNGWLFFHLCKTRALWSFLCIACADNSIASWIVLLSGVLKPTISAEMIPPMCAFANVTSHRAFTHLSVFQPLRTEKMFLSAVALVDPISCGRLDADSLPHQTLMELLVGDFDDTECFRDEDGGFKDIRTWYGVVVNTDGLVCSIEWESAEQIDIFGEGNIPCGLVSPGGCINMHWIPSSVTAFTACELNLSGSMDTRAFSHHLVTLSVGDNRFHGACDISALPRKMHAVYVWGNRLSGSLDLRGFPPTMQVFAASCNAFTGSVDFRSLPSTLIHLWLNGNRLSGYIDLRFLPETLRLFQLENNAFQQDVLVIPSGWPKKHHPILDIDAFGSIVDTNGTKVTIWN